ncbi:hypothetical protein [Litoribrevibacter albus]|uniref:Uncharacterized protein n=1 Tax=Litoribrevibacter albus TaxID=1473156 RepID=A0AA37SBV4_9GAMM|nr:hypothetical protein [Litoribrevibacter albus]GLQ31623.1 hypothetical protein GCM10007876_21020 [Litoribrevibacter albus]
MYFQEYKGISIRQVLTGEPESFSDAAEELAAFIREIGLGADAVMSIKIALEAAYKKGKESNED